MLEIVDKINRTHIDSSNQSKLGRLSFFVFAQDHYLLDELQKRDHPTMHLHAVDKPWVKGFAFDGTEATYLITLNKEEYDVKIPTEYLETPEIPLNLMKKNEYRLDNTK